MSDRTEAMLITIQMRCPKCGWEAQHDNGLVVSLEPYQGIYCLRCYAEWIATNIPKMEKVASV